MNISRSALLSSAFFTACVSSVIAAPIEVDLGGTTSYDGWSNLTVGGGYSGVMFPGVSAWPTTGNWATYNPGTGAVGAIGSNTADSADALLYKISNGAAGGPYPAGASIYFGGASAQINLDGGTLGFVDSTPLEGLGTVAFQVEIGEAFGYDFYNHTLPVLTYTTASGTGTLTASYSDLISQIYSGSITMPSGLEDIYKNTWGLQYDLSGVTEDILSFQVSFTGVQHAQLYSAQLDQSTQTYSNIIFPQASEWSGSVAGGAWSNSGNWASGAVPVEGTDVAFGVGGAVNLDLNRTVNTLTIDSNDAVSIGSTNDSVLTLGVGGMLVESSSSATHTISADVAVSNFNLWTVETGNTLNVSGDITAPGFYKKGDGNLNLSGNNTFTGNDYNQLIFMGGENKFSGVNTNASATPLELYVKDGSVTLAGGDERLKGDWSLNLYSRRFTNGDTVLSEENAFLVLGDASGRSNQTFTQIKADPVNIFNEATGIGVAGTSSNSAIVGGSSEISTVAVNAATYDPYNVPVFYGNLGGSGTNQNQLSLVKKGDGVQALAGTNTYNGATVIEGGMLRFDSASAVSANSNIQLNGGVMGIGFGDYAANLGTGAGEIQFTGNGGFAAYGADRSVTLNGGADLAWSSGGFLSDGASLVLSHAGATHAVDITNAIDLGSQDRTVRVDNGSAQIDGGISGVVSGTGSLVKTGTGTLGLTGINTYTGGTFIKEGNLTVWGFDGSIRGDVELAAGTTLTLLNTGTSDEYYFSNDRLEDSATVTMHGSTLSITNPTAVGGQEFTETFGKLVLAEGANTIFSTSTGSSDISQLTIGSLERSKGATLQITTAALGLTGRAGVVLGSTPTLDDGIIGGWATTGTGTAVLATEFVTYGATGLTALTNYTTTGEATWTASNNVKLNGGTSGLSSTMTGDRVINSLNFLGARGGSVGNNLNLGGYTLRVESGGIIGSGGATTRTNKLNNGFVTAGNGVNTAAELIFTSSGASEIGATIVDNGTGAVTLVKSGVNTLTLNSANTYTGETIINQGTLALGASGSFNASSVIEVRKGAVFNVNAVSNYTVGQTQSLQGDGAVTGATTVAGAVSGNLSFSNSLSLLSTSTLKVGLYADGTKFTTDTLSVTGALNISDLATLSILAPEANFATEYWQSDRSFQVVSTGSLGGAYSSSNPLQIESNGLGNGFGNWSVGYGTDGVTLNWTAVPEPSALVLGALGSLAMLRRRRPVAVRA